MASKKSEAAPKQTYEVLMPLNHDGDLYKVGESVELGQADAERLVAIKAIAAKPKAAAAAA